MNLVNDPFIPVQNGQLITLQQLLCSDAIFVLTLPRDDFELACLQLLIALTQTLFMPKDESQWLHYLATPISDTEYHQQAEQYQDWFDLNHPTHPFMQIRGVQAKEITP